MKKFFILLFSLIITITISACTAEEDVNVLKVSSSSDKLVGKNYQTVISELETKGFTNIKTVVLDDLVTGWLIKDGHVTQAEINGIIVFSANTSFPKDSKIVITYHTFPKKEKSDTKSTGEPSSGSAVESKVNLSKARIYNKLKSKELQQHMTKKQGVTYLDEIGFKLIQCSLK